MDTTEVQVIALLDQDFFRRCTTIDLIAELEWITANLDSDPDGAEYWRLEATNVRREIDRRQRKSAYALAESSSIPQAVVKEIKERADLAEVMGRDLQLIGRWVEGHHTAICPFHADTSPSLHIYKDHFHCFGCNKHGDVIDWLMTGKNRTWREAVEQLAGELSITLPQPKLERTERPPWSIR